MSAETPDQAFDEIRRRLLKKDVQPLVVERLFSKPGITSGLTDLIIVNKVPIGLASIFLYQAVKITPSHYRRNFLSDQEGADTVKAIGECARKMRQLMRRQSTQVFDLLSWWAFSHQPVKEAAEKLGQSHILDARFRIQESAQGGVRGQPLISFPEFELSLCALEMASTTVPHDLSALSQSRVARRVRSTLTRERHSTNALELALARGIYQDVVDFFPLWEGADDLALSIVEVVLDKAVEESTKKVLQKLRKREMENSARK